MHTAKSWKMRPAIHNCNLKGNPFTLIAAKFDKHTYKLILKNGF
ncbi:MAG: hypothetical protein QMD02_01745 [Bacteroidales bacterium]|nr:hypothetical protein [Bacteroidales bacterium]